MVKSCYILRLIGKGFPKSLQIGMLSAKSPKIFSPSPLLS